MVDWDEELLYAYKHGMDYVMKYNVAQTEFSNLPALGPYRQ